MRQQRHVQLPLPLVVCKVRATAAGELALRNEKYVHTARLQLATLVQHQVFVR